MGLTQTYKSDLLLTVYFSLLYTSLAKLDFYIMTNVPNCWFFCLFRLGATSGFIAGSVNGRPVSKAAGLSLNHGRAGLEPSLLVHS